MKKISTDFLFKYAVLTPFGKKGRECEKYASLLRTALRIGKQKRADECDVGLFMTTSVVHLASILNNYYNVDVLCAEALIVTNPPK